MASSDMQAMMNTLPQMGRVEWIGVRPDRRETPRAVNEATIDPEAGLAGDHYRGSSKQRQVTLIQAEHLAGVAAMLGREAIDPALTRRNIVVSGINLLAFSERRFRLGEVVLEMTGPCHPCSRMEENLGPGGYNAMRGHGGITAKVVSGGHVRVGDAVTLVVD
jgi:MOSC domain-containing protein YiiM